MCLVRACELSWCHSGHTCCSTGTLCQRVAWVALFWCHAGRTCGRSLVLIQAAVTLAAACVQQNQHEDLRRLGCSRTQSSALLRLQHVVPAEGSWTQTHRCGSACALIMNLCKMVLCSSATRPLPLSCQQSCALQRVRAGAPLRAGEQRRTTVMLTAACCRRDCVAAAATCVQFVGCLVARRCSATHFPFTVQDC